MRMRMEALRRWMRMMMVMMMILRRMMLDGAVLVEDCTYNETPPAQLVT
jgi:hypothetical protein